MTSIIDDIKEAMVEHRAKSKVRTKGQDLFELNRWMGEQSLALKNEYVRRKAEIEARPDDVREGISDEVLALVATAVAQGASRSKIRVALGKQTMGEVDQIIKIARGSLMEKVQAGVIEPFTLTPTGKVHGKGWPMYRVVMHDTGEGFGSVYLVTQPGATAASRANMRISPSPAGSGDILDRLFDVGVGKAMFDFGKAE